MIPEGMNCFVVLPDGTRKEFPTATEVRELDGEIEIYNDRIFLWGFKKGEFQNWWLDPHLPTARKKQLSGGRRSRR